MKFHVNESCIGCGLCEGTCPAVFHMTDAGVSEAADGDVAAADESAALDAMNGCPVSAIEQE